MSVSFFTEMTKLNYGIILNQNTTLKANWKIVGLNYQMLYRNYGKIVFWSVVDNSTNLFIFDHHLIKKNNLYCLNKLGSRELYQIQISEKPTLQLYCEWYFNKFVLDWKSIYLSPRLVTVDTKLRVFQYKILNNILFVKKNAL